MTDIKLKLLKMIPDPMIIFFARPYITGSTLQSALDHADRFYTKKNLFGTIDLLGEDMKNEPDVIEARDLYLNIIDEVASRREFCTASLKPGQMGYYVNKDFCTENINMICRKGKEKGVQVTVDMEDVDQIDYTLELYKQIMTDYPGIAGGVLQSRLWRTHNDVKVFKGYEGIFRLCIGIYEVPKNSFQTKRAMKENLLCIMKDLFDDGHSVQIATHDETIAYRALDYISEWDIPKNKAEFQLLMGVPRNKVISQIQSRGYNVRLYLPFCTKWKYGVAYLRRRLKANPNFIFYVMRNIMRGSV